MSSKFNKIATALARMKGSRETIADHYHLVLATATMAVLSSQALAQSGGGAGAPIEGALEWFVGLLQGGIARSLAVIGCIFCGYMFFAGRWVWQSILGVIVGIGIIFGAPKAVDAIIAASQ